MRKALFVLGCVACVLLIVDIGLTVYTRHAAVNTVESIGSSLEDGLGQSLEDLDE